MKIAQTIKNQIMAQDYWALARWGANSYVGSEKGRFLMFKCSGCNILRGGKIRITLVPGMDLYRVELFRIKGVDFKLISSFEGIYFDQLVEIIEGMLDGDKKVYWKTESGVA